MTLVIGHRGASRYAPENTMPAIELAQRQGADMVEFDVQQTSDGVLVLFHDDTTERWDGQKRLASTCTWAELQQLDIGGARVASLAEVCQYAREHNLQMNVELKQVGIGTAVATLLREERVEDLVLFSSFAEEALQEVAAAAPHIPRGYLMGNDTLRPDVRFRESWPFLALKRMEAQAWHPTHLIPLALQVIPLVRRAGYRVNVWTVNEPEMMQKLIDLQVDGIITDTPDVLRAMLPK
ncbi:MAG: glycerophosphodiester phosphodiesterase family protein [Roseiflexaceae bacterium]